ncbi:MAG: tetratricopeptide repeat protein [Lachnospirales bacterium]
MNNKKISLVTYWRYGLVICIMVSWIIAKFILGKSELYIIPAVLLYLLISAIFCRPYLLGLIGNFYYITRKADKAMKYYEKAVKLKTFNVKALYNYGLDKLHQNKPEEAMPVLIRAEKLNTKPLFDKLIPLAISSCYWLLGDVDKAIEILEDLKSRYKYLNPSTLVTLGYFYMLKGDYDKALEITNNALKENDKSASAYDNLGQIYYNMKEFDIAEENFKKALEINDSTVDSLYYMALICKNKGNVEDAKAYLTKADGCYISGLNTISKDDIKRELNLLK